MKVIKNIKDLRVALKAHKHNGTKIGLLPTMGALHEGHLSLARKLRMSCDVTVCSIFVNPTQFNDPLDYEKYVINLDRDLALLKAEGVDFAFAPSVQEIYPADFQTSISVAKLSVDHEGAFRPRHFDGVATVVTILFNTVEPDVAIFGEKDFQQLRIIEQLVSDLKLNIEIIRGKLVRDPDGLALSSRNSRLSPTGRIQALSISRGLFAAQRAYQAGQRDSLKLEELVMNNLQEIPDAEIDYVTIVEEQTLEKVTKIRSPSRLLVVVTIEGVRLLDNVALG